MQLNTCLNKSKLFNDNFTLFENYIYDIDHFDLLLQDAFLELSNHVKINKISLKFILGQ